jgi:hypothetical protein
MPVGGDGRLVAGPVLLGPDRLEILAGPFGRGQVPGVDPDPERPGEPVEDGGRAFRLGQDGGPGPDRGGNTQGPGDDGGVRRRPAGRGAEPDDAGGVDGGGVGGGEIVGEEQHRVVGQVRCVVIGGGQEPQHPVPHEAQVDAPGGEQGVVELLEIGHPGADHLPPRPPGRRAGPDGAHRRRH